MKKLLVLALSVALSACGYHSVDNEAIGQIKRVMHNTPLLCYDFVDMDF